MSNERIDIETIEARMRLWREGDISDEDLALELDYIVPELKRCYEQLDSQSETISELIESNTVKGEILDELRVCDECGEGWDYHPSGAGCEADRQQASE